MFFGVPARLLHHQWPVEYIRKYVTATSSLFYQEKLLQPNHYQYGLT
jgi:hypothetical protein